MVDYVLVSENILEQIFFHVSSFVPTLSDCHCKLEWEISRGGFRGGRAGRAPPLKFAKHML